MVPDYAITDVPFFATTICVSTFCLGFYPHIKLAGDLKVATSPRKEA